jgi:hypothetical protein
MSDALDILPNLEMPPMMPTLEHREATRPLLDDCPARYSHAADGRPALIVSLLLTEEQAAELVTLYAAREQALKAERWNGWTATDSAMRTLCVQIDSFSKRAFSRPSLPCPFES